MLFHCQGRYVDYPSEHSIRMVC